MKIDDLNHQRELFTCVERYNKTESNDQKFYCKIHLRQTRRTFDVLDTKREIL